MTVSDNCCGRTLCIVRETINAVSICFFKSFLKVYFTGNIEIPVFVENLSSGNYNFFLINLYHNTLCFYVLKLFLFILLLYKTYKNISCICMKAVPWQLHFLWFTHYNVPTLTTSDIKKTFVHVYINLSSVSSAMCNKTGITVLLTCSFLEHTFTLK